MKKMIILIFIFLSVLGVSKGIAQSDEKEKKWEWNIAPLYLWGFDIKGDMTIGTETIPVDVDFGDLVRNLNGAFTIHFEGVHKSNWGFIVEYNYADLATSKSNDLLLVDVGFTMHISEFDGLYRFKREKSVIDVIAGLRYTVMKYDVEVVLEVFEDSKQKDGDEQWVDPIIGARWLHNVSDKFSILARGDIGGVIFGNNFTWHTNALVNYQPFKNVSFFLGYRALGQDYETGSDADLFKLNTTYHGPLLGLNINW
jgi:hypothetical protein